MVSSHSVPSTVAAVQMDSAGCMIAHSTAPRNIRISAAFASALSARSPASTPDAVSGDSWCWVAVMVQPKH